MGYGKWKPSKTKAKEFAQQMSEIDEFCQNNGIDQSRTNDSYYFRINGQSYRVSNHTIEASDRGAYDELGNQVRDKYHSNNDDTIICITAGKTRIIEIFENLKAGKILDKRGNIK